MATESTQQNQLVSGLFNLGTALAVPFVQKLAGSRVEPSRAEQAMLAERINYASLNGSGPNDPKEAARAPQGTLDFITGMNASTSDVKPDGSNKLWLAIAALGAVLVFLALRK